MGLKNSMITFMDKILRPLLSPPSRAFMVLGGMAAAALCMAFIAEYAFGLAPCVLCVYQRWGFAAVILICALGLSLKKEQISLAGAGAAYALTAIIAAYHTGVERYWWKSFLEGCATPDMSGNITDVLARIAATPAVRCDEIPWADPILGLSMANYNVGFCLVLAAAAFWANGLTRRA